MGTTAFVCLFRVNSRALSRSSRLSESAIVVGE